MKSKKKRLANKANIRKNKKRVMKQTYRNSSKTDVGQINVADVFILVLLLPVVIVLLTYLSSIGYGVYSDTMSAGESASKEIRLLGIALYLALISVLLSFRALLSAIVKKAYKKLILNAVNGICSILNTIVFYCYMHTTISGTVNNVYSNGMRPSFMTPILFLIVGVIIIVFFYQINYSRKD